MNINNLKSFISRQYTYIDTHIDMYMKVFNWHVIGVVERIKMGWQKKGVAEKGGSRTEG